MKVAANLAAWEVEPAATAVMEGEGVQTAALAEMAATSAAAEAAVVLAAVCS